MATFGQFKEFGPYFSSSGALYLLRVYHYITGTTTLLNMWTTRNKASTVAQPLESDSAGIASAFGDGIYKFRIDGSTDGVNYSTIYTLDEVAVGDQGSSLSGEGAAISSASTLTLGTDGDFFHVTGSTGPITAISGSQARVTLVFDSTPTLTHSGNLILGSSASYTAVAGDVFTFINDGAGVWREQSRRLATLGIILATPQASTSGTSIDFTGIPTGIKRITIMLSGVSTSGTSNPLIQIGDAGGIEASGYLAEGWTPVGDVTSYTTGFGFPGGSSANVMSGIIHLSLLNASTNTWVASSLLRFASGAAMEMAGVKATSAVLDRVRITTAGGSDTFDAGSINISYE